MGSPLSGCAHLKAQALGSPAVPTDNGINAFALAISHAPREAPWFWGLDFFE